MMTKHFSAVLLSATMIMPLAFTSGCAQEISHTESDKPGWFGGRTREETTVYRNADGTTSTERSKQSTR